MAVESVTARGALSIADAGTQGGNPTALVASPVAPAALSWATPPQLLPAAHQRLSAELIESRSRFDAPTRRAIGAWLLHMIALGFATETQVAQAMTHREPFTALKRLYIRSCARLSQHLNVLVTRHSGGHGAKLRPAFDVTLAPAQEDAPPAIALALSGYYPFEVSSLHRMPAPLAAAVYESLVLIWRCLIPCILPHEMWTAEFYGLHDDFHAEYETLRDGGDMQSLEAVAARVSAGHFDYFSTDPDELAAQIEFAREMFDERPNWMASVKINKPIAHARRLKRRIARDARVEGPHPWRGYVDRVCSTLCECFPDDRALARYDARLKQHRLEWDDTQIPLSMALWVDSGAACEHQNAENLYNGMGQNGEEPIEHYNLTQLASARLRQILEYTAIGMGLLLRAEAVNHEVRRPTR